MHPIVIIASDKHPALGKAVRDLEAAGFEVRVLNSAKAKLVDFLGAIAGVNDESEIDKEPQEAVEPQDDVESMPKDTASSDVKVQPELDNQQNEALVDALVDGEVVKIEFVQGNDTVLYASKMEAGPKTHYSLNESQFSFWVNNFDKPISCTVELKVRDKSIMTEVLLSKEVMDPPVLKIGRDATINTALA